MASRQDETGGSSLDQKITLVNFSEGGSSTLTESTTRGLVVEGLSWC